MMRIARPSTIPFATTRLLRRSQTHSLIRLQRATDPQVKPYQALIFPFHPPGPHPAAPLHHIGTRSQATIYHKTYSHHPTTPLLITTKLCAPASTLFSLAQPQLATWLSQTPKHHSSKHKPHLVVTESTRCLSGSSQNPPSPRRITLRFSLSQMSPPSSQLSAEPRPLQPRPLRRHLIA